MLLFRKWSVFGTRDTESLHFVKQRRASYVQLRSRTMRTSDHPVGGPDSVKNVFAFGLCERVRFRRNVFGDTLQFSKERRMKNHIR